jgi:hypothetical protein
MLLPSFYQHKGMCTTLLANFDPASGVRRGSDDFLTEELDDDLQE